MTYTYEKQRPHVFTEEGQIMFLKMRDEAFRLTGIAGAVSMDKMMADVTGDTWDMLACVDRMVELGDLIKISPETAWAQHQIYIRKR